MTTSRGFTLIELLLVVGIIGLMSAIVMSSLTTSRGRARDAFVKRQLTEMRTLMAREFSDNGTYTNLKDNGGSKGPGATCTLGGGAGLKGSYATNFKSACDALIASMGSNCGTGVCLRFDQPLSSPLRFSIYAYLPEASRLAGSDRFLCMGSNGRSSVSTMVGLGTQSAGCYADPPL